MCGISAVFLRFLPFFFLSISLLILIFVSFNRSCQLLLFFWLQVKEAGFVLKLFLIISHFGDFSVQDRILSSRSGIICLSFLFFWIQAFRGLENAESYENVILTRVVVARATCF